MKNVLRIAASVLIMIMLLCTQAFSMTADEERALLEAAHEMRRSGMVQLNFKNMDLTTFIYFMSEVLGENIVILDDLQQKATVMITKPVTIEEARRIMIAVLARHGLTLHDEGTYSVVRHELKAESQMRDANRKNSVNITERLGITSSDLVRAMRGLDTEEAIRDAASMLVAVFQNQITEPKITSLTLSMIKGGGITLSYKYGPDLEIAKSRIVAPESGDVVRGRLPVKLLEEFINSPFTEMLSVRMRYSSDSQGYEVQWIQNNCLLRRLGIQRGDIIRAVNGIKLRTLNDLDGIIHELLKKERVELELLHKGHVVNLNYDVVSDDVPVFLKQSDDVAAKTTPHSLIPAEMVKSIARNPFDELKRIRLRPNDKTDGLDVQWLQNESTFKKLGVRKGDILTSLNGQPLKTRSDIVPAIHSLLSADIFDMNLLRDGKPEVLRYELH